MATHPKYPHLQRDTRSLLGSLVVAGIMLILVLAATSCAPPPPRAIIPPRAEIPKLDVEPVTTASAKTREAVREVSKGVDANRAAADRVGDDAQRIKEAVAKAKTALAEDYEISLAAIDAVADSLVIKVRGLQDSLELTAAARDIAIATIEDQDKELNYLAKRVAEQTVEINHASAYETVLRNQVQELSASADKHLIAEGKLAWWRNAAGLTWAFLAVFLIIRIFGSAIAANLRLR